MGRCVFHVEQLRPELFRLGGMFHVEHEVAVFHVERVGLGCLAFGPLTRFFGWAVFHVERPEPGAPDCLARRRLSGPGLFHVERPRTGRRGRAGGGPPCSTWNVSGWAGAFWSAGESPRPKAGARPTPGVPRGTCRSRMSVIRSPGPCFQARRCSTWNVREWGRRVRAIRGVPRGTRGRGSRGANPGTSIPSPRPSPGGRGEGARGWGGARRGNSPGRMSGRQARSLIGRGLDQPPI